MQLQVVLASATSTNYKNKSIYKEVVKQQRIVFDHVNPDFQATIIFSEAGNKTMLRWHMLFETAEMFQQVVKVFKADEELKQNVEKLELYLQQHAEYIIGK